jgi:lysyl-tRNA synthetase class 2
MQPMPGGAVARPFVTHHNALDMTLYLRIAPELYLKRLVVGGFEKVFELGRNFRNEGLSTRHNPEFTMLEFYQAYADYRELMDLTERLLRDLALRVLGSTELTYQGQPIDFGKPFARHTLAEAISAYLPRATPELLADLHAARALALELGLVVKDEDGLAQVQLELFEKVVEEQLIQPTFVTDFPVEVSPLARRRADNPALTERFELFIAGRELANGFSELNDPEDQAARFLEQAARKAAGDEEAMYFDADYVEALEYGLPPTAGEGIGVDRLAMLFADVTSIREVILFPHLRPQR